MVSFVLNSRSRDRDREKQREKDRERRKKGLPTLKEQHISGMLFAKDKKKKRPCFSTAILLSNWNPA